MDDFIVCGQGLSKENYVDYVSNSLNNILRNTNLLKIKTHDLCSMIDEWEYEKNLIKILKTKSVCFETLYHINGDIRRTAQIQDLVPGGEPGIIFSNKEQRASFIGNMIAETVWQPKINLNHVYLSTDILSTLTTQQKLLYQIPVIKNFNVTNFEKKTGQVDKILAKANGNEKHNS